MHKIFLVRRSMLLGAAALNMCGAAFAQSETAPSTPAKPGTAPATQEARAEAPGQGGGLEDILVTARRRTETLISVPVAVTALSAADVVRYSATNIDKITQLAPQVITARGFSGNGATFSIRGIGSGSQDAGVEQTVAINIDGVQISRGRIVTSSQFDLERVEILKGPQALFFGKNSPAGVVSITTAGATDTFQGSIKGGYEFVADQAFSEGAISGPISDTLKGRIAYRAAKSEGYVRAVAKPSPNLAPGLSAYPFPGAWDDRLGGTRELAARGTLQWTPDDRFDATMKVLVASYKADDPYSAAQTFCAPGVRPVTLGLPDTQDDCVYNNTTANTAAPAGYVANWPYARDKPYLDQKTYLATLTANYKLDDLTLTSVTGFTKLKTAFFIGTAESSIGQIYSAGPESAQTISQEFRLNSDFDSPVNFVLGSFFEHSKRRSQGISRITGGVPDPATGNFYSFHRVGDVKGDTYSGFGQVRWNIVSSLELAGGVRYTKEKKHLNIRNIYVNPALLNSTPNGFRPPNVPLIADQDSTNWSPEATLTWHPVEDTTIYAAYKTGYKSGGFANPGTFRNFYTVDTVQFGPEKAKGGEIGVKGLLFDRRVRLELTAYSYEFKGLQLSAFDATTISYQIKNAAKARTRGIEGSFEWRATDELRFRGAAGYNHARYVSFPDGTCYARQITVGTGCSLIPGTTTLRQNQSGQPLPRAPDWSLNFGSTYDLSVSPDYTLSLSGDANYTSKYFTIDSNDPFAMQKGFWRVNSAARFQHADGGWEVALIGRNILNKHYKLLVLDTAGGAPGQYIVPSIQAREVAVEGTFRF